MRMVNGRCLTVLCALAMSSGAAFGQNLLDSDPNSPTYNNPSFESPDIPFALNVMDKWKREGPGIFNPDNPAQTEPDLLGIGVFDNPPDESGGHLQDADGAQVAYIFSHSLPQGFPQTLTGTPIDHAVSQVLTNLTYGSGNYYQLKIGFANATSVASTVSTLTYSLFATTDPNATNGTELVSDTIKSNELNQIELQDFSIVTPQVAGAVDGQFIGIRISTHTEAADMFNSPGQFDFDNVRLTIVPEPSTAALLVTGALGLLTARRRR